MSSDAGRLIGYARVSASDTRGSLDRQHRELSEAGCTTVFTDKPTGKVMDRPGMTQGLGYVREGDTLVVVELSRLGRYTAGVLELIDALDQRRVGFRVLNLGLDTTTPTGRLIVSVLSAIAQLEIDLTRERVMSGLDKGRPRGRVGRPPALNELRRAHVVNLAGAGMSVSEIATLMDVTDSTIRRVLRVAGLTG